MIPALVAGAAVARETGATGWLKRRLTPPQTQRNRDRNAALVHTFTGQPGNGLSVGGVPVNVGGGFGVSFGNAPMGIPMPLLLVGAALVVWLIVRASR